MVGSGTGHAGQPTNMPVKNLDAVESAFGLVRASAERVMGGDGAHKDQTYQELFGLNNEIGRVARSSPGWMRKMTELQGYVNMITVGVKYDKKPDVLEGISQTGKAIRELKADLSSLS